MEIHSIMSKRYGGMLQQMSHVLIDGDNVIMIDAGAEVQDVESVIGDKKVLAVLITHCHFDHVCCVEDYVEKWNADVYVKEGAEEKFSDAHKNCSVLIGENSVFQVPQKNIKYYAEKLKIADFDIDVYFTPGHAADCVCLCVEKKLFCGDLVLGGTTGRCDLYDSSYFEMEKSLAKLEEIDFDTAYPGHYDTLTKAEVLNSF